MARGMTVRLLAREIGDCSFFPEAVDAVTELAAHLHADGGASSKGLLVHNAGSIYEVEISWVVHNDLPDAKAQF